MDPHPKRRQLLGEMATVQAKREVVDQDCVVLQKDGALDMELDLQRLETNGLPSCWRYSHAGPECPDSHHPQRRSDEARQYWLLTILMLFT